MTKANDLTGLSFGKMTVLGQTGHDKHGRSLWNCVCACKKEFIAVGSLIRRNKIKSCGCSRARHDLTGRRFGKLVVIEYSGKHPSGTHHLYLCQCDCGNQAIKSAVSLKNGDTKSCGCLLPAVGNMVGRVFGRLTVLAFDHSEKGSKWYLCSCACSKSKIINGHSLRRGHTQSCGCLHKEVSSKPRSAVAAANQRYGSYRSNALRRKLSFDLSFEDYLDVVTKQCHYCGKEFDSELTTPGQTFYCNGIDRVDNTQGYTIENTVPCCRQCNIAKHTYTAKEFIDWACRVANKATNTYS